MHLSSQADEKQILINILKNYILVRHCLLCWFSLKKKNVVIHESLCSRIVLLFAKVLLAKDSAPERQQKNQAEVFEKLGKIILWGSFNRELLDLQLKNQLFLKDAISARWQRILSSFVFQPTPLKINKSIFQKKIGETLIWCNYRPKQGKCIYLKTVSSAYSNETLVNDKQTNESMGLNS